MTYDQKALHVQWGRSSARTVPAFICKRFLQVDKEFYSGRLLKIDFSRLEAFVRKRESLLKFIYEKRKKGASLSGILF